MQTQEGQTTTPDVELQCSCCRVYKPRSAYSGAQLKHNASKRKCLECVANGGEPPPGICGAPPPSARAPAPAQSAGKKKNKAARYIAPPSGSSAVPDAASWRPGLPWPDAVNGPRGLPPLFPCGPGWIRDVPGFIATLPHQMRAMVPPSLLGPLIEGYVNQAKMDESWTMLSDAYEALPGGAEAKRPLAEHQAVFKRNGWILDVSAAAARVPGRAAECAAKDVFETGAFSLDPAFRLPAELPPRRCEKCKARGAAARCLCGEAYCNRQCQACSTARHCRVIPFAPEVTLF